MRVFVIAACLGLGSLAGLAQVPAAITADPAPDREHPARLVELTVPSHGSRMNAVFYLASGAGPHPTVLLLHGFPGNEQNLDLAQAVRRAGWNVLTLHYRGSWGSPGDFSLSHAIEDTDAALAFLADPAIGAKYGVDPAHLVVIGHSMGGFMALHSASTHPALAGVAVISAWNIGAEAAAEKASGREKQFASGLGEEIAPLAGCTAESLAADALSHASQWDYVAYAPAIHAIPALVMEADDELGHANAAMAQALRKAGDAHVAEMHIATDHSFSDHRIALETAVLQWLATLPGAPGGMPASHLAPGEGQLLLSVRGQGVQMYTCRPVPMYAPRWALDGPEATLVDEAGRQVGQHGVGPFWKYEDGSEVTGKVLTSTASPEPGAVPWLTLQAATHTGTGLFSAVETIHRTETHGGSPPATGCDTEHLGATARVPYTAVYGFYAKQ